jgi:hypothetical protein
VIREYTLRALWCFCEFAAAAAFFCALLEGAGC